MKKTTIAVMIMTIIAKVFGFLRDKIVIHFFGFGVVSDAFMLSFGLPSLALTVIAAALVTGFIPMYTRVKNEDPDQANYFVNNIFNIMIAFSLVVGMFMFLFPNVVVRISASGFNEETYLLATYFVRIIAFSVISVAIVQLGAGFLNVNNSFILPILISIPSNVIVIIFSIIASRTQNYNYIPIGTLLGFSIQGLMMYLFMRRYGFKYRFIIDYHDPHLRKMVKIAMPLLLTTVILTIDDIAMRSYATWIHGSGAYSYISNSFRLMGFATGLFVNGVLSVAYPTISDAAAKDDTVKVVHSMNDAILLISLFIIPATVGFITLSYEVVAFVYGGGKVGVEELTILGDVFKYNAMGLLFIGLRDLFIRIHYAYQDMKTPLRVQSYYVVLDVVLFVVLGQLVGIKGLTIAASIGALFSSMYLLNSLLNKFKRLGMHAIVKDLGKILLSAIIMGVVIIIFKNSVSGQFSDRVLLILSVALGGLTYLGSVWLMKVELVRSILSSS